MQADLITISELAKITGVSASALRYYEERELISSIGRHGLKRLFEKTAITRIALINLAKQSGFSLDEITDMLKHNSALNIDRGRLLEKANELDQKIKKLTAMRNGLRHVAKCSAPSHFECPNFLRLVKISTNKVRKRPV